MSPVFQWKKILQICILISELMIIALTIIFSIEMILINFLSDFCTDPFVNVRLLAGDMSVVTFYTSNNVTESGQLNPLEDKVLAMKELYESTLDIVVAKYNDSSGACYQEALLVDITTQITNS